MPYCEGVEWFREIVRAIVHEYVKRSRAEQHSDYEISDERIDCGFVEWRQSASDSPFRNRDADDVPDEVHDAVPPYGDRPDAKYFGRNARVGNCQGFRVKAADKSFAAASRVPNGDNPKRCSMKASIDVVSYVV